MVDITYNASQDGFDWVAPAGSQKVNIDVSDDNGVSWFLKYSGSDNHAYNLGLTKGKKKKVKGTSFPGGVIFSEKYFDVL